MRKHNDTCLSRDSNTPLLRKKESVGVYLLLNVVDKCHKETYNECVSKRYIPKKEGTVCGSGSLGNVKKNGLTQDQVAKESEIERTYYNMIERGKRRPSVEVAKRIGKSAPI